MRIAILFFALGAALVGVACRTWPQVTTDVRAFNDSAKPPMRVVMFPAVCSEADGGCDALDMGGVAGRLQSEMELAGYTIVDGATLVAQARQRDGVSADLRLFGERVAFAQGVRQQGALFIDLPPALRRHVLQEAHATAILRVQVLVSPKDSEYPLYAVRSLGVQARLGLGVDERPAWAVRCDSIWVTSTQFVGGPGRSYAQGADEGARCVAAEVAKLR